MISNITQKLMLQSTMLRGGQAMFTQVAAPAFQQLAFRPFSSTNSTFQTMQFKPIDHTEMPENISKKEDSSAPKHKASSATKQETSSLYPKNSENALSRARNIMDIQRRQYSKNIDSFRNNSFVKNNNEREDGNSKNNSGMGENLKKATSPARSYGNSGIKNSEDQGSSQSRSSEGQYKNQNENSDRNNKSKP